MGLETQKESPKLVWGLFLGGPSLSDEGLNKAKELKGTSGSQEGSPDILVLVSRVEPKEDDHESKVIGTTHHFVLCLDNPRLGEDLDAHENSCRDMEP